VEDPEDKEDAKKKEDKDKLKLQAGPERYLFPLLRDPNGSFEAFYDARLDSSAFPLSQDTAITLTVNYVYGEDSFRLVVLPEDRPAPFAPIVVQWVPGDEEQLAGSADRWNGTPEFPKPVPESWEAVALAGEVQLLRKAAADLDREARRVLAEDGAGSLAGTGLARQLDELGRLIQTGLQPLCARLWAPDRDRAPAEVLRLFEEKVFPWLLAIMEPGSRALPPSLGRQADAPVRDALARLRGDALAVLSSLRSDAPLAVVEALARESRRVSRFSRMLGRALGAGEGEREPLVQQLLDWTRASVGALRGVRDGVINRPLAAVDAALWGNTRFVQTLDRLDHVPFLLSVVETACKELCEHLPREVGRLGEAGHFWKRLLYQHVSEVLLGLLRLRGREAGRAFAAGSRRMARLARQVRRINSLFLQAGVPCRSCVRFQQAELEQHTSLTPLAYVLTGYLLGESVPPPIVIDTETEGSEDLDS
jgi:hypothetical protein